MISITINVHFFSQAKLLQAKKEVEKFAINDKQVLALVFILGVTSRYCIVVHVITVCACVRHNG